MLHSLFSAVRVIINEQPVVKQPDNYHYKAYFAQLLSYSDEYKSCQSSTVGYYKELNEFMTGADFAKNNGFSQRNGLFRKQFQADNEYRKDGAEFFGRLQLDLNSAENGLPPGTKVRFELVKSSDAFVLMREPDDTEEYQMKITHCYLYIPIAQVSTSIYTEVSSLLSSKSVAIHYRKTEVRPLTIPLQKREFDSHNLFPDDIPCRIIFAFVNDKSRQGDYNQSPFEFRRFWLVDDDTVSTSQSEPLTREQILQNEIKLLREQWEHFQSRFSREEEEESAHKSSKRGSFFGRLVGSRNEDEPREKCYKPSYNLCR